MVTGCDFSTQGPIGTRIASKFTNKYQEVKTTHFESNLERWVLKSIEKRESRLFVIRINMVETYLDRLFLLFCCLKILPLPQNSNGLRHEFFILHQHNHLKIKQNHFISPVWDNNAVIWWIFKATEHRHRSPESWSENGTIAEQSWGVSSLFLSTAF